MPIHATHVPLVATGLPKTHRQVQLANTETLAPWRDGNAGSSTDNNRRRSGSSGNVPYAPTDTAAIANSEVRLSGTDGALTREIKITGASDLGHA
jgi:hypothetical protein